MRKKVLIYVLLFFILCPIIVSAEEVQFSFYANGGTTSSTDFSVNDYYDFIGYKGTTYASYTEKDTIKNINSISGKPFILTKQNDTLVSGREWYVFNYYDGKTYYFNQSSIYKMEDVVKQLGIEDETFVSLSLYANWNSNKKTGGIDVKTSSTKSTTTNTTKNNTSTNEKKHYVIIKYNTNSGSLDATHSNQIKVSKGYIYYNGKAEVGKILYGGTTSSNGLADYNNPKFINITRKGYIAKKGAEWNTKADGKGKSYSQYKAYKASDFCNAKDKDCAVTLYVNWEKIGITLDKTNITVDAGSTGTIKATTNNSIDLVWKVENSNIAKVSNGKITGLNEGKTTITVTAKQASSISKKITVSVNKPNKKLAGADKTVNNEGATLKKLGEVDLTNYNSNCVKVPSENKISSAQGFTVAGDYYLAAKRNADESLVTIFAIKTSSSKKSTASPSIQWQYTKDKYFGHANAIAYNPKTRKIYVTTTTNGNYKTFSFSEIENKSKNPILKEGTIYRIVQKKIAKFNPSGIEYSSYDNKFYLGSGANIYIYDSTLTNNELHIIKAEVGTTQDIGAYKGHVLVVRWNPSGPIGGNNLKTTRNAIDLYSASTGKYEGSYIIKSAGEMEGVSYNEKSGKFAFYMQNITGSDFDCIQEASMNIK